MARMNELEQRLLALKQRMESGLLDRARALREFAARLDAGDATARKAIKTESHKLRGVAGTYGHQELTDKAAELEQRASLSPPAVVGRMARDLAALVEQASANSVPSSIALPNAGMPARASARPPARRPSSRPASTRSASHRPAKSDKTDAPKHETLLAAGGRKLRVLAMDDDPLTLRLLALTLKQIGGFDATIVESATVALELLAREQFDIVVSDAMMPEMNGKELCVRAREIGVTAPVIILSAASPEELGWASSLPGATAWLRKPFKPSELVQDIARIAKQHAAAR